ncbi:MAG: hypothetical protein P1U89_17940 [Verrucomicrobiales bacterium]|nr:hypothetical protein [Verrucomicrobiales bacterium]
MNDMKLYVSLDVYKDSIQLVRYNWTGRPSVATLSIILEKGVGKPV